MKIYIASVYRGFGDFWRVWGVDRFGGRVARVVEEQQIPGGNDRKKGKGNGRSRFPEGMTERKTKATAKEEADSRRE